MLWGLLLACTPGFQEPETPEYTASLRSGLSVDPFSGMLWVGRVEQDPQTQSEVDAEYEAILTQVEAQGEFTLEQLMALAELDAKLLAASTARVSQVDPAALRATEVGAFRGESAPLAVFAPAGVYLGAKPVDAQGYATGSMVYEHPQTDAFLRGGRLEPSPLGGWFLRELAGTYALVPDSLGWSLPLASGDYAFLNNGELLGLRSGELLRWDPGVSEPTARIFLPEGVRPTQILDLAVTDQHALLAKPYESGQGIEVWLVDLVSGALSILPAHFIKGKFTDEGGFVYGETGGVVSIYSAQGNLVNELSFEGEGEAWLSPDGGAMVYENEEGVGWQDLATGASTFEVERDLYSFQYAQGRLWITAPDGVESLDLDTGVWEMWPAAGCSLTQLVVLPDEQTLAGRCGDSEVGLFDTLSGAMTGRVGL